MGKATKQIVHPTQIFEMRGAFDIMYDKHHIVPKAINIFKKYMASAKPHLKNRIKIDTDETVDNYKRRFVHVVQIVLKNSNGEMLNYVHIELDHYLEGVYTGITFCAARGPVKAGYLITNTDFLNERVLASFLIMATSSIDSGCDTPIREFMPWLQRKKGMVRIKTDVDSEIIPNCFLELVPKDFTAEGKSSSFYRSHMPYSSQHAPAVQQLCSDIQNEASQYKFSIPNIPSIVPVISSKGRFYINLQKHGIDYFCNAYAQYRSILMTATARIYGTDKTLYASAGISLEPPVDAKAMFTLCLLAQLRASAHS